MNQAWKGTEMWNKAQTAVCVSVPTEWEKKHRVWNGQGNKTTQKQHEKEVKTKASVNKCKELNREIKLNEKKHVRFAIHCKVFLFFICNSV